MQKEELDIITGAIVDCAYQIHSRLGPGLVESVYELITARKLTERGFAVECQKHISFEFDGVLCRKAFVPDMIVERCVVVEFKSAERIDFVHVRQLHTYLKILDLRVGLLLNFGAALMKDGIRRVVNNI